MKAAGGPGSFCQGRSEKYTEGTGMDPVGCLGLDTVMQAGGFCVGDNFNNHRWETLAVSTEGTLMVGKPGRDPRPGLGCTSLRDQ